MKNASNYALIILVGLLAAVVAAPRRLRRSRIEANENGRVHRETGAVSIGMWMQETKGDLEVIADLLNGRQNGMSLTYAPTSTPTTCLGVAPEDRSEAIGRAVLRVSDAAALSVPSSPQARALQWITDVDTLSLCPDDQNLIQRYVAAVFYYSTEGDNWTQCSAPNDLNDPSSISGANADCNLDIKGGGGGSKAWLSPVSECDWGAVRCEAIGTEQIEIIDFEGNGLGGTLPLEMQELKRLRLLHLEEGTTGGTIPAQIGNLAFLEELDLNFNLFVGPIPDNIYGLSNLKELDLNDNLLEGTISSAIGNLSNLRFFQISKNLITGSIPEDMGKLTGLAIANFDRNKLTGAMPQGLCDLRDFQGGDLGSLTSDCLDAESVYYVECQSPECCTACFVGER